MARAKKKQTYAERYWLTRQKYERIYAKTFPLVGQRIVDYIRR